MSALDELKPGTWVAKPTKHPGVTDLYAAGKFFACITDHTADPQHHEALARLIVSAPALYAAARLTYRKSFAALAKMERRGEAPSWEKIWEVLEEAETEIARALRAAEEQTSHLSSDGSTVEGAPRPGCGCQSCRHTFGAPNV